MGKLLGARWMTEYITPTPPLRPYIIWFPVAASQFYLILGTLGVPCMQYIFLLLFMLWKHSITYKKQIALNSIHTYIESEETLWDEKHVNQINIYRLHAFHGLIHSINKYFFFHGFSVVFNLFFSFIAVEFVDFLKYWTEIRNGKCS